MLPLQIFKRVAQQQRNYAQKVIKVPPMAESITSGKLIKWTKKENEVVDVDEVVCQIETDKVIIEARAPEKGVFIKKFADVDATVTVGQDLFVLDDDLKLASAAPTTSAPAPTPAAPKAAPTATPAAAAPEKKAEPKKETTTPVPQNVVSVASTNTETRVKMTSIRKRISQRLKDSQNTYAMLTTFNDIDMSNVMEFRSKYKDEFEQRHKVKLGFMGIFTKAAAQVLKEQPIVNAVIDGEDIVYRDYVDISVAVSAPNGLVVPVLRNCEGKSIAQIEGDIASYADKAKKGTLKIDEMQGGTFTISNGGVFGSLMGTPIINPPQSAILGMHAINKRPIVVTDPKTKEDVIVIRPMMYVALTYDHRIIDGREAVTFLKRIKELVENPERLLLN